MFQNEHCAGEYPWSSNLYVVLSRRIGTIWIPPALKLGCGVAWAGKSKEVRSLAEYEHMIMTTLLDGMSNDLSCYTFLFDLPTSVQLLP